MTSKGGASASTKRKARPESYRRWRCPGKNCDNTFVNPIPITGVWCNNSDKHSKQSPVIGMVPDEDSDS